MEWLVNGDPEQVLAGLDGALGPAQALAAAVYRESGHVHRDAGAGVRRQMPVPDAGSSAGTPFGPESADRRWPPDGRLVAGFGPDGVVLAPPPAGLLTTADRAGETR